MTSLEDLSEGDRLYIDDTDTILTVTSIDADFDTDGLPDGTVTFDDQDEEFTTNAETVDMDLHTGAMSIVDPAVIENADQILFEFASSEISTYAATVGREHDFNGISHVDTVRDLAIATQFAAE